MGRRAEGAAAADAGGDSEQPLHGDAPPPGEQFDRPAVVVLEDGNPSTRDVAHEEIEGWVLSYGPLPADAQQIVPGVLQGIVGVLTFTAADATNASVHASCDGLVGVVFVPSAEPLAPETLLSNLHILRRQGTLCVRTAALPDSAPDDLFEGHGVTKRLDYVLVTKQTDTTYVQFQQATFERVQAEVERIVPLPRAPLADMDLYVHVLYSFFSSVGCALVVARRRPSDVWLRTFCIVFLLELTYHIGPLLPMEWGGMTTLLRSVGLVLSRAPIIGSMWRALLSIVDAMQTVGRRASEAALRRMLEQGQAELLGGAAAAVRVKEILATMIGAMSQFVTAATIASARVMRAAHLVRAFRSSSQSLDTRAYATIAAILAFLCSSRTCTQVLLHLPKVRLALAYILRGGSIGKPLCDATIVALAAWQ